MYECRNRRNSIIIRHYDRYSIPNLELFKPYKLIKEKNLAAMKKIAYSGDLLLFKSKCWRTKLQRYLTGSDYDHVAIILKLSSDDNLEIRNLVKKITGENYLTNDCYILEAIGGYGVICNSWNLFLENNWISEEYDCVVLRQLIGKRDYQFQLALWNFAYKVIGSSYNASFTRLARSVTIGRQSISDSACSTTSSMESIDIKKEDKNERSFFCSELVAAALKDIGVLEKNINEETFWPICFTLMSPQKLPLDKDYQYSQSYIQIYNKKIISSTSRRISHNL